MYPGAYQMRPLSGLPEDVPSLPYSASVLYPAYITQAARHIFGVGWGRMSSWCHSQGCSPEWAGTSRASLEALYSVSSLNPPCKLSLCVGWSHRWSPRGTLHSSLSPFGRVSHRASHRGMPVAIHRSPVVQRAKNPKPSHDPFSLFWL